MWFLISHTTSTVAKLVFSPTDIAECKIKLYAQAVLMSNINWREPAQRE